MPPCTTKRTTTILKNKKTKKPELTEIQLYGSLTTKAIKKKDSSRPVGVAEMGSRAERTRGKVAAGGPSEVAGCGTGQARLQLADPQGGG